MVTYCLVVESYIGKGWFVYVNWGSIIVVRGPYRWKWLARIVAWLEEGIH